VCVNIHKNFVQQSGAQRESSDSIRCTHHFRSGCHSAPKSGLFPVCRIIQENACSLKAQTTRNITAELLDPV
jgi:hypothetical protein